VKPGDMLKDKLLVNVEELAVRDDILEDTVLEFEVEEYPKISTLKALTKLPVVLEKVPGLDLR
jgi:hypothetical protein